MNQGDKRIYRRLNMKINIRYVPINSNGKIEKELARESFGAAKNLSAGGLAFSTNETYKVGTLLQVTIELPMAKEAITCLSRVVRCAQSVRDTTNDVAVCFLDLSSKDSSEIGKFVNEEARYG